MRTDARPQGFYPAWADLRFVLGKPVCLMQSTVTYVDASGNEWTAELGMETDGGSKPRVVWRVFGHPFDPEGLLSYLIHDAICLRAHALAAAGHAASANELRLTGDRLLVEMLRFSGVNAVAAWAHYRGVRFGAWISMGRYAVNAVLRTLRRRWGHRG